MADDAKNDKQEAATDKKGMSPILLIGIVAGTAVLAAALVFVFLIKPLLNPAEPEDSMTNTSSNAEDIIPVDPRYVELPSNFVHVIAGKDMPMPVLVYQIDLECVDAATEALVNKYLSRIVDMVEQLHASRTREELADAVAIKSSIAQQAKQQINDFLRRAQGDVVNEDIRVTSVLYKNFMVQDQ